MHTGHRYISVNVNTLLADKDREPAEVIFAGGRGMKNGENFALLFQCAEKINAGVAASRVAVDSGWVP